MRCKTCKAKDQTIAALAEQIDWLRLQMGTPWLKEKVEQSQGGMPGYELASMPWVSEEEADIEHMRSSGLLSSHAAAAALEQIGALNTEVTIN